MESYSVINQTATPHSNLQNSTVAWSWWPEVNTDSDDDELIKISQNGKKKNQTKLQLKFTNVWHLQMWTSRPPNQRPGPCEGGLVRVHYLSFTEFKPCVKHKACRPNLAHHVIICGPPEFFMCMVWCMLQYWFILKLYWQHLFVKKKKSHFSKSGRN